MGFNDQLQDLGTVYSKTGSALTTSYTFGTTQLTGQATRVSLFVKTTEAAAASSMGNVLVKLMAVDTSGNRYDVVTTRNNAASDTKVEHTIATVANTTTYELISTANFAPSAGGWCVAAKADGATVTGDSCIVLAVVM